MFLFSFALLFKIFLHSGGCVVVLHYGLICISQMINEIEHLCTHVLAIWVSSLVNCLFEVFAYFKNFIT